MKRTLLFYAFWLSVMSVYGQSMQLPANKYSSEGQYQKARSFLEDQPFEYSIGYSSTRLLNSTYGESNSGGGISPSHGYYINLRYTQIMPLILEAGYSYSKFNTGGTPYFNFGKESGLAVLGFDLGASFVLMPSSKYLRTYLGAGYGFYEATSGTSLFDKKASQYRTEKAHTPYVKVGALLNLSEYFYLNAEYKQSFAAEGAFDFNQFNFGIGWRSLSEKEKMDTQAEYLEDHGLSYALGYTKTRFNNPAYSQIQDEAGSDYGFYLNLRLTKLMPVFFEMGYSYASFPLGNKGYYDYLSDETFSFSGFDVSANLTLPGPNAFMPYMGLGYGYYSSSLSGEADDSDTQRSTNTNEGLGFWKAGFMLNTGKSFFFDLAYKQSFGMGNQLAFSQLQAGMGFRVKTEEYFDKVREHFREEGGTVFSYGYHQTDFLNPVFKAHIESGNIERKWGHIFNFRMMAAYPLMIDLAYFSSNFSVSDDMPDWPNAEKDASIRHRGGEVALSFPLVSVSHYFIPYVGFGYQLSQLYAGPPFVKEEGVDYDDIQELSANTSSAIYKLGVTMNTNSMSYAVEYKRSLFNDEFPFYQLAVTAGVKF